jgi:hypothetical protein
MIAATISAILTGARHCDAIAAWLRAQDPKVWHWLGFRRKPPCSNTFRTVLAILPAEQLEQFLREWMSRMPRPTTNEQLAVERALALDGKTLCGSLSAHQRSVHLLALFDQQLGGVLGQLAMPPGTNEHKAALLLLKQVLHAGDLVTGDAMFCQRDLCQQVVEAGADYLLVVKENQPELHAAIAAEFEPGLSPLQPASAA